MDGQRTPGAELLAAEAADALRAAFGRPCEVRADASIRIGGLKASCEAKGLVADDTLDNRLQNQHGWFLEHAGLTLEQ